jgi:hypothetical protein
MTSIFHDLKNSSMGLKNLTVPLKARRASKNLKGS